MTSKRELRRDLRTLWERYLEVKDSENPEEQAEARRLLREHEHVRMELIDLGGG